MVPGVQEEQDTATSGDAYPESVAPEALPPGDLRIQSPYYPIYKPLRDELARRDHCIKIVVTVTREAPHVIHRKEKCVHEVCVITSHPRIIITRKQTLKTPNNACVAPMVAQVIGLCGF